MATTPTTTPAAVSTASKPASPNLAKRGNNRQPARQAYKVYRPSQTVKRWTETLKGHLKVQKLTPEQRGAIAFFTLHPERGNN